MVKWPIFLRFIFWQACHSTMLDFDFSSFRQRAKISDKWLTSTGAQSYCIDKIRKWKPGLESSDPNHNSNNSHRYKFLTIARTTCDLNGLEKRGNLQTEMMMVSELGPICSIFCKL